LGENRLRHAVFLGGVLAVAIVLTLAGGVRDADAAFPGANGRIAYVSDREAGSGEPAELYTIDPDGTDRLQLTTTLGSESNPAWSADGAKIAFDRAGDIFVLNADGSGETNVTNSPGSFELEPAWSPDGTKLVFRRVNELFTIGVDGTNEFQLTDYPDFFITSDFQPAWSPDGTKIVFQ
jgi:TolB protein